MNHDPHRYHRRSIRLKDYDYTQPGGYYLTICTQDRTCRFGVVVDGEMRLNEFGEIVRRCWIAIPDHFPQAALDAFVIMPNHVHGIIWIVGGTTGADGNVGRGDACVAPTTTTISVAPTIIITARS